MKTLAEPPAAPTSPTDTRKGVQSVERAFEILRAFEKSERPLSVKDIAERAGMTASQAHHYLVSLTRAGAIKQRPDGLYELGVFTLQLGLAALRHLDPVQCAVDAARAFRDETGEATFVSLWGSHGATIIRYFEGFKPVTVETRAGTVLPLLGTATGRVFLTWMNESVTAEMVRDEDADEVNRIRIETRQAGLGHVHGQLLPRIAALSTPVFDRDGELAFSIAALGWIGDFDDTLDGALAQKLRATGHEVSAALGHAG